MENDSLMLPPFEVLEKTPLKYSVQAPKIGKEDNGTAEICLMPQCSASEPLLGRFVTDGEFKGVSSDDVFKAVADDDTVSLAHCQNHDQKAEPFIREIVIGVISGLTFLKQKKQTVKIVTVDRFSKKTVREITGVLNDETNCFHYAVNEKITFDKTVNYSVVSAMKLSVSVVY